MGKLSGRSVVLVALIVGLIAASLAAFYLDRQKAVADERSKPVRVLVATEAIPARTIIEPGMVREATRPAATVPALPASEASQVVGQVTLTALAREDVIKRDAVAQPSASLGLAYVVPEGMRAVTVALDPIIGVAGFLNAGDHVDVLATFVVDKLSVTKTVLQDVLLLAIGPLIAPSESKQPTEGRDARPTPQPNATLALVPVDAEKLILAESQGKLRLTLRRMGDPEKVALSGIRSDNLIGLRPGQTTTGVACAPRPAARIVTSTGYTQTPSFFSSFPSAAFPTPKLESRPLQPFAGIADGSKAAAPVKNTAVSVETIRGTQKTVVDVRPE